VSLSFGRLLVATASTKRNPAITGGKRGEPVAHLASVTCTRLYPVDAETQQRLTIESPYTTWVVFADGEPDVEAGDRWVQDGKEFAVKFVEQWPWPVDDKNYRRLVVEENRE
jgi:hypothetical protein